MRLEALPPMGERHRVVQAQDLDVGHHQAGLLDRTHHFGERRRIAAGKDVLAQPGIGGARRIDPADGVQERHPVLGQEPLHRAEILGVVAHANMLEHADRDDAVEAAGLFTIVAHMEADPVGETGLAHPLGRHLRLLLGEREAGHLDAVLAGEVERQPAPAGADVEHALAGLKQELGGDERLLCPLRLVEAHLGIGKVRAGVLQVGVEEHPIEVDRQIVVMRHVLAREPDRVALLQRPESVAERPGKAHDRQLLGQHQILRQ